MDQSDIDCLATRIVETLLKPQHIQALSRAIAKELRFLSFEREAEEARLGERLDARRY
jgi:hypothetical protein